MLILRDVLEWPAAEVADLLGTTTTAVNSGLRRARAQLAQALPAEEEVAEPAEPDQRALLDRFAAAIENADASALAETLREDVALEMPPVLTWFSGRQAVASFVASNFFTEPGALRPVAVMANGQPAFAVYQRAPGGAYHAHAVLVLTVTTTGIARIVSFQDPGLFTSFGLPHDYGAGGGPAQNQAAEVAAGKAALGRGLELLESAISYALAAAALGTPQLLNDPTPCPGWNLAMLLDHVSDSIGVLHAAMSRGRRRHGVVPPDYPRAGARQSRGCAGQAAGMLRACAAAGPAELRIAIWDRELTVSMVAVTGAIEITVHGWDISVACGARRPVPPGLGGRLAADRPAAHHPGTRPGLFADPVRLPGPASPGDQLVAFLGRQPRA